MPRRLLKYRQVAAYLLLAGAVALGGEGYARSQDAAQSAQDKSIVAVCTLLTGRSAKSRAYQHDLIATFEQRDQLQRRAIVALGGTVGAEPPLPSYPLRKPDCAAVVAFAKK